MDVRAVHLDDSFWLARQVDQLGHGGLHAEGHLVLSNTGLRLRVGDLIELLLVHSRQRIKHATSRLDADSRRVGQEQDGIAPGAQGHALVFAGQKARAPETIVNGLRFLAPCPRCRHDHERRQVVVLGAKTIAEPRSQAGPARHLVPRADIGDGRIVIDRLGPERPDDGDVVHHLGRPRHELADPGARLSVLGKLILGGRNREAGLAAGHRRKTLPLADRFR